MIFLNILGMDGGDEDIERKHVFLVEKHLFYIVSHMTFIIMFFPTSFLIILIRLVQVFILQTFFWLFDSCYVQTKGACRCQHKCGYGKLILCKVGKLLCHTVLFFILKHVKTCQFYGFMMQNSELKV